jgi:adenosine deaminase CECR1
MAHSSSELALLRFGKLDGRKMLTLVCRSKLSHDFYQVFAGKTDMTLYGWKQLAVWSIEHSCMDAEEKKAVMTHWKELWNDFCLEIIKDHSHLVNGEPEPKTDA